MKTITVTCIVFILSAIPATAQMVDSLHLGQDLEKLLATKSRLQFSTDSLGILSWSDSLKSKITGRFNNDSLQITRRIDSLQNLRLPTDKLTARVDSLARKKIELTNEVDSRRGQLLARSKSRLELWKSKVREKLRFAEDKKLAMAGGAEDEVLQVSGKIGEVAGKTDVLTENVPELAHAPSLNAELKQLQSFAGAGIDTDLELPELPELELPELKTDLSPDLTSLNEKLDFDAIDNVKGLQQKIDAGAEQLNALREIPSNPDKALESAVENIDQIDAMKEQLGAMDQVRNNEFVEAAEKLKDPSALQEEARQIVVQQAVNHFEGKEQVLQEAMGKLEKYKKKYESLNSLSDIRKLPKNTMKGKPFRERFLPGVALQILHNGDILLDMNPYAGYRITGRLTAGAGWNQRIGYSTKHNYFTSAAVIYGPRTFGEVKTWKGFIARAEFEWMNTEVPPRLRGFHSGENYREWVRTAFVGLKREYRFLKNVKGTAMVMFSIYNDKRKSPYGDVINSRFGFEFPLAKKKVNRQSN